MDEHMRLEARVRGKVQGVGFRFSTRQEAERLGLVGSATNRPDGSVEVIAEGPPSAIRQLLAWLNSAHAPGRVDAVESSTTAAGAEAGFTAS
jgi:acylphosphatase